MGSGGKPRCLSVAGKGAVSILESHGIEADKILRILDLRLNPAEWESFKQISSITDEDVHRKNRERIEIERAGMWKPSWTGRASSR